MITSTLDLRDNCVERLSFFVEFSKLSQLTDSLNPSIVKSSYKNHFLLERENVNDGQAKV